MNVVVFSSPLQLLNALEAAQEFCLDPKQLSLLPFYVAGSASEPTIENVMQRFGLQPTGRFVLPPDAKAKGIRDRAWRTLGRRRVFLSLAKYVRDQRDVECLMLGNLGNRWQRSLALLAGYRELLVLDDGYGTVPLVHRLAEGDFAQFRLHSSLDRFVGLRSGLPEGLHFFTAYPLPALKAVRFTRNVYRHLRASVEQIHGGDQAWFLGQPLTKIGVMGVREYVAFVARQLDRLRSDYESVTYFPHRHEAKEIVVELEARGYVTRRYELPIEILGAEVAPGAVISFVCSALFNFSHILPGTTRLEMIVVRREDHAEAQGKASLDVGRYVSEEFPAIVPTTLSLPALGA